ncbi:hypothetical protein BGZ65_002476 [Modicella reniformis]|uniref:Uncharacterized protein n=1 Tax=Modicella reniformis TaxID=1440133 RepID=A0A9P6J0H7_9FUNG|nr:hypothetical protein BGZ65_002476 [Modicella reniformis]
MRTSQQQYRQEERRRHAARAAAAGTGASPWFNKQRKKSIKWKAIAGAVFTLFLIVLAGILSWYFVIYKKNQDHISSARQSGGHAAGPTGVVVTSNYPLKRVFYGMAYVPMNAQLPNCYNTG